MFYWRTPFERWVSGFVTAVRKTIIILAFAVEVSAQNAIWPIALDVRPNFNTASVYASFVGDQNLNATASLEYRAGETEGFRPGHPLARTGPGRFTTSIFHLQPDQTLEVRVTFDDPDRSEPMVLAASVRTRSEDFPTGSGATYYVGPNGDNSNPGTISAPFRDIQRAVDMAGPGDTINVLAGDYFESVEVRRSGNPGGYIRLRGAPENLPGTHARIIGWVAPTGLPARVDADLFTVNEARPVGTVTLDGTRIYHHLSLEELKAAATPLVPGWWQDDATQRVYIRTSGASYGVPQDIRLGVLKRGIRFRASAYWIVEDLMFEVFGGGLAPTGIVIWDTHDVIVRHCTFDTMRRGVYIRGFLSIDCLVEQNVFRDTGIWAWGWDKVKGHDTEGMAVGLDAGTGNVVRFNDIRGFFDGIATNSGESLDEALNCDMDIHNNSFTEIGDDCIELALACMNTRVYSNRANGATTGVSVTPVAVGPIFVIRDRYINTGYTGVKTGSSFSSTGLVYLYHVLSWVNSYSACNAEGDWDNLHFRNCIIRGARYAFQDFDTEHPIGCTFDGTCFYSTGSLFIRWAGVDYRAVATLPPTTFGPHNISLEPYPAGNVGVPAGLAYELIDAGVIIPGVNDDFTGDAPDIGPDEIADTQYAGLLAYWPLDETAGSSAADTVGGSDGILHGSPAWRPTAGVIDGALELDGIDDCMETPLALDPGAGPFSAFAWVKGGAPGQVIVSQDTGAKWLLVEDEGVLATELSRPAASDVLTSLACITDGNWHRVGVTWDGSTRTLYVDDADVAADAQVALASRSTKLYIGAAGPGYRFRATTFFSGLIDDVRVYNGAVKPRHTPEANGDGR